MGTSDRARSGAEHRTRTTAVATLVGAHIDTYACARVLQACLALGGLGHAANRWYGHERNDLTGLNHFAEGLAGGIFTDEAWVENVPASPGRAVTAKRADGSATFVVDAHSLTVCRN